jgi:regulator of protease activity HflC (stomatin/prohibitin superfamily)
MTEQQNDWQLRFHAEGTAPEPPEPNPATEALSHALRLSFRLLTVIMVLLVVAFLMTGIRRVKPTQVGIRSVFGRIIGVADQGLTYTWPFPIGRIEMIDTSERTLQINDFWMLEEREHVGKPVSERSTRKKGLLPDEDGALLTGDGNLLHVRLICTYEVGSGYDGATGKHNAVLYKTNVNDQDTVQASKDRDVLRSEHLLRAVVCRAAIRAAAHRTADFIRDDPDDFNREVKGLTQAQLDAMQTGLEVRSIAVGADGVVWPLQLNQAYKGANKARHDAQKAITEALSDAQSELARVAGESSALLVGEFNDAGQLSGGLIDQYIACRDAGDEVQAQATLKDIQDVMINESTGRVRNILQGARTDRAELIEPIKARLGRYNQLLEQYQRSPELTRSRLWADTREAILGSFDVSKWVVNQSDGIVVIQINEDPAVAKAKRERLLSVTRGDESEE